MSRIMARDLARLSMDTLWEILQGKFTLIFDDGEIETNWRATLYSAYAWDFHRKYPHTPMLMSHHIDTIIGDGRLSSNTHLKLLGNCMFSAYDAYKALGLGISMDLLRKQTYELTNLIYNELTYKLEEYVVSIDITDFMAILKNKRVAKANADVIEIGTNDNSTREEVQTAIDTTYREIKSALMEDPALSMNPIALAVRSKLVDMNQVNQCVGPRGFLTDIDSHIFDKPVLTGYARGIRSFHDSIIESRSAAKSLIFSKAPLQDAEYFSRRLQLMCQIVKNLHEGDCGTTEFTHWHVRGPRKDERGNVIFDGDLNTIEGKYFLDTDNKLKVVKKEDKHLIGRTLKMRSVLGCGHPDPYGICTTCFGELSLSVPAETNIGHMTGTSMTQKSSQSVLSVKHIDGSSVVEGIVLDTFERRYLKVAPDNNSYMLGEALRGKNVKLVIPADFAQNITDILRVKNVEDLNIMRVSELDTIGIRIDNGDLIEDLSIEVNIGRRQASMTYPMLRHIRAKSWAVDAKGDYLIDLEGYDWAQPFLTLPLKHINMSDHSKDISTMLESSVSQMHERDKVVSPQALLAELNDLVNSKLSVNIAVLEVVLYAAMIRSADDRDYGLPKPWTKQGVGVMSLSMANRSLAAAMAYEGHRDLIVSPMSYILRNRPDHPMDGILLPEALFGGERALMRA